ncbi:MAG: GTP-binding protein, partial [Thaumarchaeota archaeon]
MKFKATEQILKIIGNKNHIRNFGVIAHVDHGKTTMSDSLLASSGIISPSVAGQALALDSMKLEQDRQMTIVQANVTLLYEKDGGEYVINMIDTPGHIDFTGRVTRSLRAIDGAVVVSDSVEGIMTQTETVTRQALEERVRPVLYINKIDRLIKELRLAPEKMQEWLLEIISNFNRLIEIYAEPEYKEKWKVSIQDSSVSFGSAKDKWGFNADVMKEKGISFKDIFTAYSEGGDVKTLAEKAPLYDAVLGMVVKHHPPPDVAQRYRIPKIWKGRIQSVNFFMGNQREMVGELAAGNIPALLGLEHARAGQTLSTVAGVHTFEGIHYVSEPVVQMAVEPKHPKDLPKLVEALNRITIEDPNLVVKINEESGETIIAGMGVLHLEIATALIADAKVEIVTSQPLINYRETIRGSAGPIMTKSPNRHNKILMKVEPLDEKVAELIRNGTLNEYKDEKEVQKILKDAGWESDEAKRVMRFDPRGNVMVDGTKGVQFIKESSDSILSGFEDAMKEGPLAREQVRGCKFTFHHFVPHEDPAHRGLSQLGPASRRACMGAMCLAQPVLLEPTLGIEVRIPQDLIGDVAGVISGKRGKVLNMEQKGIVNIVTGEIPASETFDLSEIMRGQTAGKAMWNTHFKAWTPIPNSILPTLVGEIRKRKGLSPEPATADEF